MTAEQLWAERNRLRKALEKHRSDMTEEAYTELHRVMISIGWLAIRERTGPVLVRGAQPEASS